jgi:hypothetical protein
MLYAMTKHNIEEGHKEDAKDKQEDGTAILAPMFGQDKAPADSQQFGLPRMRKREEAGRLVLGRVRDYEHLPQLSRSVGFVLPVPLQARKTNP